MPRYAKDWGLQTEQGQTVSELRFISLISKRFVCMYVKISYVLPALCVLCDLYLVFSLDNAASEGVLASFFNSLLSKKTGSPGSPGAGGVQSTAKKSGIGLVIVACF